MLQLTVIVKNFYPPPPPPPRPVQYWVCWVNNIEWRDKNVCNNLNTSADYLKLKVKMIVVTDLAIESFK